MLLGAAGSAVAIIGMTEAGLYDISVEELRDRYIRSDGESMAGRIAVDYAEANLGGVPEAIAGPTVYDLGPSGKTGWLYGVFNPALAGYVLKDAEGNVLESGGAENLSDAEFYSFPVSGSYKYVLSITEKSETAPQADASTYNAIPEGGALVLSLSIETEDSSGSVDSVEPIGNIYDTGNGVRFEANPSMGVIDLPDAPTTCVTFVGVDGSVLYQTYNDVSDCFSENESGYLVFDTTRELSQSEVLLDDVPTEGADIYKVTFSTESELAGEGEHTCSGSSPVGVLKRNDAGVLYFQSGDAFYRDNMPQDAVITAVEFRDKDDSIVYRASNPAGVGEFEWDANGTAVVFRVTPSLTQKVMPEAETLPETTSRDGAGNNRRNHRYRNGSGDDRRDRPGHDGGDRPPRDAVREPHQAVGNRHGSPGRDLCGRRSSHHGILGRRRPEVHGGGVPLRPAARLYRGADPGSRRVPL